MMGTSDKKINTMNTTFANMLGFINGRIYYNLTNWYSTLKLLPGYNFNKGFMEGMMGVKDKAKESETIKPLSFKEKYLIALPELLIGIYSIISQFIKLNKSIAIFFKNLNDSLDSANRIHFSKLNDHELISVYKFLQSKLLSNWKTPIVNDFFTMIFYGILKKLVINWELDPKGNLQNDLLCGEGDIESTKPTKLLIEISNFIRTDLRIKSYILNHTDDEIYEELFIKNSSEFLNPFKIRVNQYLDLYGFRCINELKLEEDSLKDNPRFIFGIIRNYLKKEEMNLKEMEEKEREKRYNAEKFVKDHLDQQKVLYVIKRSFIFNWILKNARLMVKNRENLRFGRTRVFGTVREIMNALGNNFVRNGKIDHFKDIYFLTVDEIISFCDGRAVTLNLKELIAIRKKEYFENQTLEPPERFFTYGSFYTSVKIVPKLPDPLKDLNLGPHFLKGVACSPGLLKEKCKVILSPKDEINLNGEILVTARTDPGWVPIFPTIKGLLIEKGSILSHSAVVAREMGIPTIVGLTNVTKKIQDNQVVVMDGSKGLVSLSGDIDEMIEVLI
ncbi:MAG: PEP-utilizing enzyme [Bacteriovoracaceae bacterium]